MLLEQQISIRMNFVVSQDTEVIKKTVFANTIINYSLKYIKKRKLSL